jgi:hypothetical protein
MANNLMNRFGTRQMPQAPIAPMQQRKPGMVEQFAQGKANEFANEQMNAGLGLMKDQAVDALGNIGGSLGFGAEAGSGMEAAMFEAAPFEAIGAEGITATGLGADVTALGTGLAEGVSASTAGTAAATGGAATGLAAAMPWVGAGLLAGKAFGLFSKGGPVYKSDGGYTYDQYKKDKEQEDYNKGSYGAFYAACGGKMPKYRAEGGRSDEDDYRAAAEFYSNYYDRSNKPKYDNSPYRIGTSKVYSNELPKMGEKQMMVPAEYRASGGPLGLMAINKYHDKLQNDPLALSPAAALFRAEGSDEPESGGFWNYFKKSFTEKPAWEDYEPIQVSVTDSQGNPVKSGDGFLTYTDYQLNPNAAPAAKRQPAPVEDRSVNLNQEIARDIYGEYDDGEDMGDASYLAGDPAPYSVQTYPLDRRGEIPMKSNMPSKGGPLLRKFGAPGIRREPEEFNRDLNEYSINRNRRLNPQPDDGSGIWEDMKGFFSSMGSSNGNDADVSNFNMGGRVGPLKSVKYKSAGGNVSEQSYYNPYGK